MAFLRRALYRTVGRQAQAAARREWQKTAVGQLLNQATGAASGGGRAGGLAEALLHASRFPNSRGLIDLLSSTDAGTLVNEVARYSKAGGADSRLVDQLLDALGPAGKLLRSLASLAGKSSPANSVDRELGAARSLLEAFGYEVLPPPGRETADDLNRGVEAAREFLESRGYRVEPAQQKGSPPGRDSLSSEPRDQPGESPKQKRRRPGERETFPQGVSKTRADGKPRKVVDLDLDGNGGGKNRFPVTHPIVTGQLVRSPESSNVYGFFYNLDTSTLYVRFKFYSPGTGKTDAPGSLYAYSHVPPKVFLRMMDAPSKGTFVWDNLRIRGTVSGHKHDYRLVAVRGGYVPRKATVASDGEWFIGRTVRTRNIRTGELQTISSRLPDRLVRASPNQGTPNRGTPNRG